jgi:hypothetical protein
MENTMHRTISRLALIATLAASALLLPLRASAQAAADKWNFSLAPYLWLPGIKGTLNYGPPSAGGATPNVSVDADKLLDAFDFGFMLEGEARKGRWLIGADAMYMKLSGAKSGIRSVDFNPGPGPINISNTTLSGGADVELKNTLFTLVGGYELLQQPRATLYAIGGLRYVGIEATTNWNLSAAITGPAGSGQTFTRTGSVTKSENIVDAIIGVRGRINLGGSNWFVPYHLDVGAGDSDQTYQAVLGIAHSFKWGDAYLSYRYLYYDMGSDKLLRDFAFSGPALGLNFRF